MRSGEQTRARFERLASLRADPLRNKGRPCIFIMNHTSFLDAFVTHSITPYRIIASGSRVIAARFLIRIPIFGWITKKFGCFEVHFKNSVDFKVGISRSSRARDKSCRAIDASWPSRMCGARIR